jgi:hypothetical protein
VRELPQSMLKKIESVDRLILKEQAKVALNEFEVVRTTTTSK